MEQNDSSEVPLNQRTFLHLVSCLSGERDHFGQDCVREAAGDPVSAHASCVAWRCPPRP